MSYANELLKMNECSIVKIHSKFFEDGRVRFLRLYIYFGDLKRGFYEF